EVCAVVVGWGDESAVHVGVAARFLAEKLTHRVELGRGCGVHAPLCDSRAADRREPVSDDAERLAGGMKVGRSYRISNMPHIRMVADARSGGHAGAAPPTKGLRLMKITAIDCF